MILTRKTMTALLAVLIAIGVVCGGLISWQRYQVEHAAQTVEMVYDYNNILENAAVEGKTVDALFDQYRKSGITSLAIYDETAEKLVGHGFLQVYRGYDFASRHPEASISQDKIYLQPVANDAGRAYFDETKEHLSLLYGDSVKTLTVDGVDTLEVTGVYNDFMTAPLGVYTTTVNRAAETGFYLVLRPVNIPHASRAYVDSFFRAVDASDKVSAVLFQGKEVFGYKDHMDYVSDQLNARHLPMVLIEAQNQLGFERQSGLLELADKSHYNLVRLYAMSKDELIKLAATEASARFYISDIERNIRMNLFPSYKFSADGMTLSETNCAYIAQVRDRLENHGFTTGKASVMEGYFPSTPLKAGVMMGAVALLVLALTLLFPGSLPVALPLLILGIAGALAGYFALHRVLVVQLLALGAAVCTPVVVVTQFLNYCVRRKDTAFAEVGWGKLFGESLAVLWCAGIASLAGALFVSGLLSDIRFFLEIQYFRGVKVTFLMPLLLISIIYIQKFPFFGKVVASDKDFVSFVKKFCNVEIKLGLLCALGFLSMVGLVFIGRSGNNGAPVPGFEIALRRFLEDTMYARPREKEFLFGHPAVLVSLAALYRKWPQILHYFLIVAVTIGQGSMVETFAHMRSPFELSFIRGLDGLAAGSLSMVGALVAVMILARITKFFGERYGRV